jgi:C1A family cysteine protease
MRLAEQYGDLAFLRIKNSWGTAQGPLGGGFGGYHDLTVEYLNGPIRWTEANGDRTPLSSVILPFGF